MFVARFKHSNLYCVAAVLVTACDPTAIDSMDDGGAEEFGMDGGADDPGAIGGPVLPEPNGTCPTFRDGTVELRPDPDRPTRTVRVWMDEDAADAKDGPVVFYWYGTFGRPEQAVEALGTEGIERITAMGGIVVAPTHVGMPFEFPWITNHGVTDFALADEVLGCAERDIGIDERRIHSLGFSAGALFTSGLSIARSSYIASVATYSGGLGAEDGENVTFEEPSNKFAAFVLHGGEKDDVFGQNFVDSSERYRNLLEENGNFVLECEHGQGHQIVTAAAPAVVQFLLDHAHGAVPSPYAQGELPPDIARVCSSRT